MHTPTLLPDPVPMPRWPRALVALTAIIALLVSASPASANAGTPLMWFTMGHLLIGNLAIGVVEGLILARWLKLRRPAAIGVMILANYVSAWGGYPLAAYVSDRLPDWLGVPPLNMLTWLVVARFTAFLAVTILIEWPFVWFLIRKSPRAASRSFRPCVGVQLISYAALVPLYLFTGTATLATDGRIEPTPAFASPANAWVYFINPDTGQIWRIRLDGTGRELVSDSRFTHEFARLFLRPNGSGSLDLCCVLGEDDDRSVVVWPGFAKRAVPLNKPNESAEPNTGKNYEYRDPRENPPSDEWYITCGIWPGAGIRVLEGPQYGYALGFELPFTASGCFFRNAAMYSKRQGVFQLDDDIIVIDAPTKRLAHLTHGRGPVVVLDPIAVNDSAQTRPAESKQD